MGFAGCSAGPPGHRARDTWLRTQYASVHEQLASFLHFVPFHRAAGWGGPWIENYWIESFRPCATSSHLNSTFGGRVPLFVPWTDLWVNNGYAYPKPFVAALLRALAPDVKYVTRRHTCCTPTPCPFH